MIKTISIKQLNEIEQAKVHNKDPQAVRKLTILSLRGNGALLKQIAAEIGCTPEYASKIIRIYYDEGLEGIVNSCHSHFKNSLSFEEEESILAPFIERAERCELVKTKDMAEALRAAVPYPLSQNQIYTILHRHGWHQGSFRNTPDE